ncbi:MAG: choice-of-anchor B family protein [Gemmatimonadales bacterium]
MTMSRALRVAACLAGLIPAVLAAQTNADPRVPPGMIAFGSALVVQGDVLFAGRPSIITGFPMPASASGAVVLFRRGLAGWTQATTLTASGAEVGDGFGAAIAVDGDRLVVGAPGAGKGRGAAYVFRKRGDGWEQVARLDAAAGAEGDGLGSAVAVNGNWIVVGAPGAESGRGVAYAWRQSGEGWTLTQTLAPASRDSGAGFGRSLAVDSRYVLVGAPGPGSSGGPFGPPPTPKPGRVYAWFADGPGLRDAGMLQSADTTVRSLGASIALADGAAWAGAPASGQGVGAVLRFTRTGGAWREAARLTPAEAKGGKLAGTTIQVAGPDVLVGAPVDRQGSGSILVFRRGADGKWAQAQALTAETTGLAGLLGSALSVSGDVAVAGAPFSEFFSGVAFVYTRAGGEWTAGDRVVDSEPGMASIIGGERKCQNGKIEQFTCSNVDLLAFLPNRALGAPRGIMMNDIWGWTDPDTKREYALVGRMNGTAFVDVTQPATPVYIGDLPLTPGAQANLWRDIKTYKNYAFIVSDGAGPHGMQVFDLTRLRHVDRMPTHFTADTVYHNIHSAHNIVIDDQSGFAYIVGASMGGETCGGALHMVDIRDPMRPTFAGCYADVTTGNSRTGYTHDAQCVVYHGPDERYTGREICFNSSETAVGIADLTDKANPKPIGKGTYPKSAYVHQGWLSEDQRYFFVDDEGDEVEGLVPRTRTIVFDVKDLEDPVVLTEFLGTTASSDHNLYVRGHYVFESNYVSGLRVLDIADPANPREVGYFDTVPFGEDMPGFAGSWSNYPFFPSGTIVVTSMQEGLFILKHRPEAPVP